MILFWTLGALLAAGALALAARPFWRRRGAGAGVSREALNAAVYRDQLRELDADLAAGALAQTDYDRSRQEIERRVLEDFSREDEKTEPGGNRAVAYAVLALPLVAVAIYVAVGNPGALNPQQDQLTQQQIEGMVARLAAKLKDNPDDVTGWKMLARSYTVLGRFDNAAEAYAQAATRAPRDAQLLADFADALAMAQGRSLAGDPEKLLARALEVDPQNLKALALAGTAAFDRGNFAVAAAFWQRMLPLVPGDSEDARAIRENVAEAQVRAGAAPKLAAPARKAPAAMQLAGTVSLAAALKRQASPDDTVFIFARASEGPPMPLAVLRKKVRDLPVPFALDDSLAMAPSLKLSAFPRVVVSARVSKSGNAAPQPGDLQGASGVVANNARGVKVVIDTVVGDKPAKQP
ncbi:MAG TPA: c-type cytochrome biogenesis protein CcmI [Burkholderiales bacterium]